MKKISIDDIIAMVDSRYSLVTIVSRRARQIIDGSDILVKTQTTKPVAIAIEEFYENKYQPIYDYEQYKKNQQLLEAESEKTKKTEETEETEKIEKTEEIELIEDINDIEEYEEIEIDTKDNKND